MNHMVRFVVAGTLLSALAGCGQGGALSTVGGSILTPTVDSDLQAALPQVLGPGTYSVQISGLDTTGHANEVDITGVNMQPTGAPVIASMTARFFDVNFNDSSHQITHVGAINLNLNVTAADLTTFLTNQKGIPDSQVTLTPPDQLGVVGNPNVPGLGTVPVVIQGHVIPASADVTYILDMVQASGSTVTDPTILGAISSLYNPIVDLSSVPAHPSITSITVSNGTMNIVATGFFP